jgi:IS30 family transposase
MSNYYLTISEREGLLLMYHNQKGITQIAGALGRSKSTISRKLRRNKGRHGYSTHEAQNSYTLRRRACKPQLKVMRLELRTDCKRLGTVLVT